jgi:hypothetical protein
MKIKVGILFLLISVFFETVFSQTVIVTDDPSYTTGASSAMLDVKSVTKGILIPRLSQTERNNISSPAAGLLIFQTDNTPGFYYYSGAAWTYIGAGASADGSETKINSTTTVAITGSGTTGTPYTATYSTQSVTQTERNALSPYSGQVIWCNNCGMYGELQVYNGTSWTLFNGSATTAPLAIGDIFQGGKIAYIFQTGDPGYIEGQTHGIIAMATDQSSGVAWGCSGTSISTGTILGTGSQNTINIEAGCSTPGTPADLCANLESGGYSDWFLPSADELYKLYLSKSQIGMGTNDTYWSSTQRSDSYATRVIMTGGTVGHDPKNNTYKVRAIRNF